MAFFNEFAASAYLYIMMLLTEFWGESNIRNSVGWGLLFFLGFVVSVNFIKVLWKFCKWVKMRFDKYVLNKFFKVDQAQKTVAIKTEID